MPYPLPRELKSITGYREVEAHAYNDFSGNPFVTIYRNDPFDMRQHQFSQELQLFGNSDSGRFDYLLGLYYFDENGRERPVGGELASAQAAADRSSAVPARHAE